MVKDERETKKQPIILGYLIVVALIVSTILAAAPSLADGKTSEPHQEVPKQVLILNSHGYGMPWQRIVNQAIYAAFEADTSIETELHAEYTGLSQNDDDAYVRKLLDMYNYKYAGRKMDLIIAVDLPATNFIIAHGEDLFPGLPIVFINDSDDMEAMRLKPNMTGLLSTINVKGTLDVALELHPGTRHIAVISGASKMDRLLEAQARKVFQDYENRLDFIDLTGLPMAELLSEVARQPEHTIAFYVLTLMDGAGEAYIPKKILPRISQASNAPLYGLYDALLGGGIVGGHLSSAEVEGDRAAGMALRILGGEKPEDIPIVRGAHAYMFDWRQLQRWGIRESDLPPGSVVRHKLLSFWVLYKWHIISVAAILVLEGALILILLIQNAKRRRAEEALRESEKRYRSLFKNNHSIMLLIDPENADIVDANPAAVSYYGWSYEELTGKKITDINILAKEKVFQEMKRAKKEQRQHFYFRHRLSGGKIRDVEVYSSSITVYDRKLLYSIIHDITERKKAEETLRRYEHIVASTNDHMSFVDCDYVYRAVNDAYLTAHDKTREEIVGHTVAELFGDDFFERLVKANFDRCLRGETVTYQDWFEFPGLYKRYLDVAYYSYREADGTISGVVVSSRDITALYQAQETLAHKTTLLDNILRSASDVAIATTDLDFRITYYNPMAEKLFGYTAAEVVGKTVMEMHTKEEVTPERFRQAIEIVHRKGEYFYPVKQETEDGLHYLDSRIAGIFSPDGELVGFSLFSRDVTESKQAEEALQESEEKYRSIMESMRDSAYIVSPDFRIEYINPRMISRIGCDTTGEPCHKTLYDSDEKCFWCAFGRIQKGEHVEYELANPVDNRYYSVLDSPIYHSDGTISKLTIFRDITESKAIEEQLRQARKMESIGTLTGGIAHDFNNILYMITGNAELALEDIPEWNPAHAYLKEIKAAGLRAAGIVKQLLSFSRKTDQELKPIGAVAVIKDALRFLRSTIPATIEIRKHLPDTDVTILADSIQINQVLMNICTNASQAMEESGGILEINVENESLTKDFAENYPDLTAGDYVKITVSDTGPGIDTKIIDKIFDPYFTTREFGKGSGMGLSVVLGIVKNHGGAITVDSQPGKGATFTMLFPVAAEKPVTEAKTSDGIPLGTEAILFVDDEESIANMNGQMLERLGYKVETRTNPVEALELFESKLDQFDLVITDMTMPQMTGVRLSEKLKEVRSDIPVIICTGHSSLVNEEKAKELGIAAFVMKPILKNEIAGTVRKILDAGRSVA